MNQDLVENYGLLGFGLLLLGASYIFHKGKKYSKRRLEKLENQLLELD